MPQYAFEGKRPRVAATAFIAPTATLIGDVTVGEDASIWFGAILRGDFGRIEVGAGTSIQDNAVVHCDEERPTIIGRNVTIAHLAQIECCVVGDGALIGTGAVVLPGASIGARSLVGAGAVVAEGQEIPAGVLAAGVPAEVRKPLDGSSRVWVETSAEQYRQLKDRYRRGGVHAPERSDEPEEGGLAVW